MRKLTLCYDDDGSFGNGWIEVRYASDRYSGIGMLSLHPEALAPFALRLRDYPLKSDRLPCLSDGATEIRIEPEGSLGKLILFMRLTDLHDGRNQLRVAEEVTYAFLDRLANALGKLVHVGEEPVEVLLD